MMTEQFPSLEWILPSKMKRYDHHLFDEKDAYIPVTRDMVFNLLKAHSNELDSVDFDEILNDFGNGMVSVFDDEEKFQEYLCETVAAHGAIHPHYGILAGRLFTKFQYDRVYTWNGISKFSELVKLLYEYKRPYSNGKDHQPLISKEIYDFFHKKEGFYSGEGAKWRSIDEAVHKGEMFFQKKAFYDYSASQAVRNACIHFIGEGGSKRVAETRASLFMRVSCGIHGGLVRCFNILQTFTLLCRGMLMHASPTLFNSGTMHPQCSSCFLTQIPEDSVDGIYENVSECAKISKGAGGLSVAITKIRANKSYIAGTNGISDGIAPMLKVYNDTARYIDQGGGRRKGAFAMYLEPWHADILDFLSMKRQDTNKDKSAPDLHYGLMMPDLFYERVRTGGDWSLFCPNEAPGLQSCWGEEFEKLYTSYEKPYLNEGTGKMITRVRKTMKAEELFKIICDTQMETGEPYMIAKDTANRCNNQQHTGMIHCSNLCTEIMENTSSDESAVCNLASIPVNMFARRKIKDGGVEFDYEEFGSVVKVAVENLNRIIDLNHYPTKKTEKTNKTHRPIGLGIQGLQNLFWEFGYPFDSEEARILNRHIFEALYYYALDASADEAANDDGSYDSYEGSQLSKGIFHFEMMGLDRTRLSGRFDWDALDQKIRKCGGVRNSLLIAPMPTRSTSRFLNNIECFEAQMSNIIVRKTNTGEYVDINRHLVYDLEKLGIWNEEIRSLIIAGDGSIQNIEKIPLKIKSLYKTVWEIRQQNLITLAAERQPFIDQSQSFSAFIAEPSYEILSKYHMSTWMRKLKTGMYYLHMKPSTQAIKFTLNTPPIQPSNANLKKNGDEKNKSTILRTIKKCDESCDMCGA
jgi:ribonucleoside-diphosphate reductase alpha subunit